MIMKERYFMGGRVMEIFYEQYLHLSKSKSQNILNSLATFFLLAAGAYVILFNFIIAIVFLLIFLLIWFYCRQSYVEYEYELTVNELVISKILNQKKRRIIGTIDLNNVSQISKLDDVKNNKDIKFIKCYLKDGKDVDVIIINESNGKVGYKVTMDNKMKEYCKRINPKVFIGII